MRTSNGTAVRTPNSRIWDGFRFTSGNTRTRRRQPHVSMSCGRRAGLQYRGKPPTSADIAAAYPSGMGTASPIHLIRSFESGGSPFTMNR
jgi:hypothetical protein